MPSSEDAMLRETLRGFCRKEIEPHWEALDTDERGHYLRLWAALQELGITSFGLPESLGGVELSERACFDVAAELGRTSPALAAGLVIHVVAQSLIVEGVGAMPPILGAAAAEGRLSLVASPLDRRPETSFVLQRNGTLALSGERRAVWPHPQWLVVPVLDGDRLLGCVLPADAKGVELRSQPSCHGLSLLPFGTLTLENVVVSAEQLFEWPTSGRSVQLADGLLTAVLHGMSAELAERAMTYALERYQGGKMIYEHDAVQQLVAPIELSLRVLEATALQALSGQAPADGGASAFAVDIVRQSALDAIQTYGGYGYMQDYRVERYLRDANTLETFFIHAAERRREIARGRFAQMRS